MDEHPNDPIKDKWSGYLQTGRHSDDSQAEVALGDGASYADGVLEDAAIEIEGELVTVDDTSEDDGSDQGPGRIANDRVERPPNELDDQDHEVSSPFEGGRIAGRQDPVLLTTLSPQTLEVQPGASTQAQVQLLNNGDREALFEVLFEGWIDPAWLNVNPIYKTLQPGERVSLNVTISPPCKSAVVAGPRQIVVVVRSTNYPGRESRQVALLNVLPYDDVQLGAVTPLVSKISWDRRSASFAVPVTNNGNHTVQARIQAQAESADFHFEPVDPQQIEAGPFVATDLLLTLTPGQEVLVSGSIQPRRMPLLGIGDRVNTYRILANVAGKNQVPRAVSAQLICRPLFGPRRLALLSMLLTLALVALLILSATGFGLARIVSSLPIATNGVDIEAFSAPAPPQSSVVAVVVPVGMLVPTAVESTAMEPAAGQAVPIVISVGESGGDIATSVGANVASPGAGRDLTVPLVAAGEVSQPGQAGSSPPENRSAEGALPVVANSSPTPDRSELTYAQMFQEVALRYDLDWRMLAAQAYVESSFDTLALGSDGDLGLMQVLPRTWKEWAPTVDVNDPFDAYSNVLVAGVYLDYLRSNLSKDGFSEARWMLIAYNWGPEKLSAFLAEGNGWDNLPDGVRRYAADILRIAESIPAN